MRLAREIMPLLLAAALLLATGAWVQPDHGFVSSDGSSANDHTAGCHAPGRNNATDSHVPNSPRPAPVRYRCCLTGHDVATAQAFYASQPLTLCERALVQIDPSLGVRFLDNTNVPTILFADPPGMTSLRI